MKLNCYSSGMNGRELSAYVLPDPHRTLIRLHESASSTTEARRVANALVECQEALSNLVDEMKLICSTVRRPARPYVTYRTIL